MDYEVYQDRKAWKIFRIQACRGTNYTSLLQSALDHSGFTPCFFGGQVRGLVRVYGEISPRFVFLIGSGSP